jgi:hypothetical protein
MDNNENRLAEIGVCQTAWSQENTLLQAYRGFCAAIETFLLGIGLILLSSFSKLGPFWLIFGAGITVAIFWIVVCIRRADIVNMWSKEVIARAAGKILIRDKATSKFLTDQGVSLDSPYEYEDTKPHIGLSSFMNWGLPVILIIIWIIIAIFLSPSTS